MVSFAAIALMMVLSYCSDSEMKPRSFKKIDTDELMVDKAYLAPFSDKYNDFINGLSTEQKSSWENYIALEEAKIEAAKLNVGATCSCGPGMATCSASGAFSDCCVCWNPATQVGACGVYFGLAMCKTENNPPPARVGATKQLIKFYPNRFVKMLDDMDATGINTNSIRVDLETLISHAEAE